MILLLLIHKMKILFQNEVSGFVEIASITFLDKCRHANDTAILRLMVKYLFRIKMQEEKEIKNVKVYLYQKRKSISLGIRELCRPESASANA